jgi:hypothetical protein
LREQLLGPEIAEAAARLAQFIALVNSVVDSVDVDDIKFNIDIGKLVYDKGEFRIEGANVIATGDVTYNPNGEHIAAVEVFLLRNLGYQSAELNAAADFAWLRDKDNPFFEYLAHSPRRQRMLELFNKSDKTPNGKCPSRAQPSVVRFQWFPERGEEIQKGRDKTAWAESMYWDCIFLAKLYESDVSSRLSRRGVGVDPFGVLSDAFSEARKVLSRVKEASENIEGFLKQLEDTVKPEFCKSNPNNELCKIIPSASNPCVSIEQCGKDAFCRDNPNNTLCQVPTPSASNPCVSIEQCGKDAFCRDNPDNTLCQLSPF